MTTEPLKKMCRPRLTDTELLTLVEEVESRGCCDTDLTVGRLGWREAVRHGQVDRKRKKDKFIGVTYVMLFMGFRTSIYF